MKKATPFAAVLLLVVLTACAEGQFSGGVLFRDDFANRGSGWDRVEGDFGSTDYYQDGYRIYAANQDGFVWANPGQDFEDVSVEVDTSLLGGDLDNAFGIICRYADIENYYAGVISSDGFYAFLKLSNGELAYLNMDQFLGSEAINQGNASNHIRLDCVGNRLSLYANGELLGETSDGEIPSGDVGLFNQAFTAAGADILFDNFVVNQP